jgi:2-haloalkanoic acid dehalogenase type II
VLFDLLTALLDSWALWNESAGSEAGGRAWRDEYLRLTYGCGAYVPYEDLVRQAASNVGLGMNAPAALEDNWEGLRPWDGAQDAMQALRPHSRLAVVTNCSSRLGTSAARRLGVDWDVVVTAQDAGFYKPHPYPYELALSRLGVPASASAFVAGSGYDLIGTSRVGLRTYWHNRVGLSLPPGAPAPEVESPTLGALVPWLQSFQEHEDLE